jgi:hypothetical protein
MILHSPLPVEDYRLFCSATIWKRTTVQAQVDLSRPLAIMSLTSFIVSRLRRATCLYDTKTMSALAPS